MTPIAPGSAELLALANRIKKANSISLMEQSQKPGPLWAMPLGDREQAATVAALRLAAKPAEEVREATIKECAIIAGSYATVSPRCAKLAATAIRALSTTGAPKP